ncbi:MAG: hypothetical protein BWX54_02102 [Verrucomicrobia bacterium ADurb.Bin018]|nr:MAG: hypothetical protein BWX54_02102 [Verrucomicrobia bacterium ADurb.Bin018]
MDGKHVQRIERAGHLNYRVQRPAGHFCRSGIHYGLLHLVRGQDGKFAPNAEARGAGKRATGRRCKRVIREAQSSGHLHPSRLIRCRQFLETNNVRFDALHGGQHRRVIVIGILVAAVAPRINAEVHIVGRNAHLDRPSRRYATKQRHRQKKGYNRELFHARRNRSTPPPAGKYNPNIFLVTFYHRAGA